ncbi:MAG TPA: TonB-dependent receptor [Terriglobales bacterium]|nr:TonB-dependent receptor [Terriglobales bacterium]
MGQTIFLYAQRPAPDLSELSLEDLMNVRVTSAAKKEQSLSQTAAAVYVITAEEIRRSGVTTLTDALRLAPGVQVAQLSSDTWAISIRGFNAVYSNKLLVLIDGRSVYSAVFSGVLWNEEDLMLEDIERIEVIRGPGAALWGSNAVNGVINIITRPAHETQGTRVTLGGGSQDRGLGKARYGGSFRESLDYRIYGKYFNRNSLGGIAGVYDGSGWSMTRGGFRADWKATARDNLTFEGSMYRGEAGQIAYLILPAVGAPGPVPLTDNSGGDFLLRWKRHLARGSEIAAQAYYDRAHRGNFPLGQNEDALNLDFQHHVRLGERNDMIWGGGFCSTRVRSSAVNFTPASIQPHTSLQSFSAFAQDEVVLVPERLWATAGARFEHNDYTGWESQPTLRLLWKPRQRHALWAAASRAVRIPSVYEVSIRLPVPAGSLLPFPATVIGNSHLRSESLLAYELGYRVQAAQHISLDVAAFYNRYNRLVGYNPLPLPPVGPLPQILLQTSSAMRGQTYGGEFSATYIPVHVWSLQGSYSLFRGEWSAGPGTRSAVNTFVAGQTPRHQFQIRSSFSPLRSFQFDTNLFYVSGWTSYPVPAVTRVDTRLGWTLNQKTQFDFVVQNALQPGHVEFFSSASGGVTERVRRAVYGKITLQF